MLFLVKALKLKSLAVHSVNLTHLNLPSLFLNKVLPNLHSKKLQTTFLKKSLLFVKRKIVKKVRSRKRARIFFFLSRFVVMFLEFLFKKHIVFNLKKGSRKLALRYMSYRAFRRFYFRKSLKVSRQIVGVIYYSLLLKDSCMFVRFFKKILEKVNIKFHKKLMKGLKKLIRKRFKRRFKFLGVIGLLFSIRGKVGVRGNAKKRRYFFHFGKHSIVSRHVKMDTGFSSI